MIFTRTFDYKKIKNIVFDCDRLNQIFAIYELKGRQETHSKLDSEKLEKLVEIAKVQSVEGSNAIEGIKTTNTRIKQLTLNKTTPKNRSEQEILGYRNALSIIHESYEDIPLTVNYILQLHKILFKEVTGVSYGGKFKDVQNYINGTDENGNQYTIFVPLSPYETRPALEKICDEYNKAINEYKINPIVVIAVFIHDFLCIHPFIDGNGRMSRLLTALLLYRNGFSIGKYISIEAKINKIKDLYYDALQESQYNWNEGKDDPTPFISFMLDIIEMSYVDFIERIKIIEDPSSSFISIKKVIYEMIGKIKKSDIIKRCPHLSSSTIEKALSRLVKEGQLEKKGSGKNTFYIKVNQE